jgi:AAHS family 4-hydroxybenzoate transporter-like MFS transporter
MFVGSAFLGALGDRFGRRPVVIAGTAGYAVVMLLSTLSASLWALVFARFAIGIFVGAMLPSAIILAGELFKNFGRARMSASVTLGITVGSTLTSIAAATLLPSHGWRGLFVFCGLVPLAFAALLWAALPESPEFKAQAGAPARPQVTPAPLFRNGLAGMTAAIWVLVILLSMTLYLLGSWTPLLLSQSGLDARDASLVSGAYYFGGLMGGVLIVLLLGRSGWSMLGAFLLCAAGAVLWVSQVERPVGLLMLSLAAAGVFVTGSQCAFNGLAASAYPVQLRAAGLGYALGISRVGSIGGPMIGAALIGGGLKDAQSLFVVPVAPLLAAACIAVWLAVRSRRLQAGGQDSGGAHTR